jgi:hypothetical protein
MRLDGTFEVRDNWIYVTAPTGAIRTYQGRAEAWDLMVRVGLATCSGAGQWKTISESQAVRLALTVGFTRDSSMLDTMPRSFVTPLQMDLGIPPGANPDQTWITFNVSWPIEGVIASYTLHSGNVIRAGRIAEDSRRIVGMLCR